MDLCDHLARHGDGSRPRSAGLIYPAYGHAPDTPSRNALAKENVVLTGEVLEWFTELASGGNPERIPARESIALRAFPATHIVTCGFDPLRDEGLELMRHLVEHGVAASHSEHDHLFHGFITLGGLFPEVTDVARELARFSRHHLATT